MVVQHILCSRMGKREVKPVVPVVPKTEPTAEKDTDKEESAEDKDAVTDDPVKEEEEGAVSETTEKEIKTEVAEEEQEEEGEEEKEKEKEKKNETDNVKKEDSKKQEEPPADSKTTEIAVPEAKPQMIEVEEYFVKYRNFSYLHCEWRTEEEMYKGDKRIQAKLKRFKQKQQQNTNIFENVLKIYYLKICLYQICN